MCARPGKELPERSERAMLRDHTGIPTSQSGKILKFLGHWGEYLKVYRLISELKTALIPSKEASLKGLKCSK